MTPEAITWAGYAVVLLLLALTVAYELFAAWTQVTRRRAAQDGRTVIPAALPTITEAVRRLSARWRWLKWVGTIGGAILILHFWWGLW